MSNTSTQAGLDLDNPNQPEQDGPVECLGKTFANDQERRDYYLAILAEKLKDPEFRKIEGFPIGEDEDILNLSDPPYYTACPNPFIEDFIAHYGRPYNPDEKYKREPYAADVSEGKNDPIYNAHSYHTKVPHKAIMRYILHYTEPGDVVFDGFCGTGMTGVAAQMCGDKAVVESLGYRVAGNNVYKNVFDTDKAAETKELYSAVGSRYVALSDLSPLAAFVASRYNSLEDLSVKIPVIEKLLSEAKAKYLENYSTIDPTSKRSGFADFYIWSEVFSCPECMNSETLFDLAVDPISYKLYSEFTCPKCSASLTKDKLERVWTTSIMPDGEVVKELKTKLVQVVSSIGGKQARYQPSKYDTDKIELFENVNQTWVPEATFPLGRQTRKVKTGSGISYVTQMFTARALSIYSYLWAETEKLETGAPEMKFLLTSVINLISRRERFRDGTGKGAQSGTLYVPSLQIEKNFFTVFERKLNALKKLLKLTNKKNSCVSVNSGSSVLLPDESVDYVFIDPPFGESLQYAELNYFTEAWLKVYSSMKDDCVLNYVHKKSIDFYLALMKKSFSETYRILKPGRWITVEFSNSQASVWNSIQTAIQDAGFIVANVSALDKKQRSFNSVITTTSVKQDLVISAYKPNGGFEDRFVNESDEDGVWDFVRTHLGYLPIVKRQGNDLAKIPERDPRILFDQVVAYFVRNLRDVPLLQKNSKRAYGSVSLNAMA